MPGDFFMLSALHNIHRFLFVSLILLMSLLNKRSVPGHSIPLFCSQLLLNNGQLSWDVLEGILGRLEHDFSDELSLGVHLLQIIVHLFEHVGSMSLNLLSSFLVCHHKLFYFVRSFHILSLLFSLKGLNFFDFLLKLLLHQFLVLLTASSKCLLSLDQFLLNTLFELLASPLLNLLHHNDGFVTSRLFE